MDEQHSGLVDSVQPDYFENMYQADSDPWGFATSDYEAAKYSATLAELPCARYKSGLEIGCSIGVLTERLAERCDNLLAIDVSGSALKTAQARCQNLPQVKFELRQVPQQFPPGSFDLILMSEVGYYLGWPDLLATQRRIVQQLRPGGHLLLVHYTPFVGDAPLTGDEVHTSFLQNTLQTLHHRHGRRYETYRLDLFERR